MYRYEFDAARFRDAVQIQRSESQPRLAHCAGLSRGTIAEIEGGTKTPGISAFLALCSALHLAPSDYIMGDPWSLTPGAYQFDMSKMRQAIVDHEAQGKPWPHPQISERAVSYMTAWRVRRGGVKLPHMGTWLSLCEWLRTPPSAFLEAV